MVRFFFMHGAYGNPDENWFPWLKGRLEDLGHEVIIPHFPTPENQSLDNWFKVFDKYLHMIDKDTIFVGHSIGPAFILRILERIDVCIKAAFLVSGFCRQLGIEEFDSLNHTFIEDDFNWKNIRSKCRGFYLYHSDNDPYVPLSCAKELESLLDTHLVLIHGAGHFNSESGYLEFNRMLDDIIDAL